MLDLLVQLYGSVSIPAAVAAEAMHPNAPIELRNWMQNLPAWAAIADTPGTMLPATMGLGRGEAAAITMAWECATTETLLILDDLAARNLCQKLQLRITGTGGVITAAAVVGLIDFETTMDKLQATTFHLSDKMRSALRKSYQSQTLGDS